MPTHNMQIGLFIFGAMLLLVGAMFLLATVLLAYFEKSGSNYAMWSGGIALLFATILFTFSHGNVGEVLIKVWGLEAQIKKSEKVIEEANATIEQLREMALTFAEPTFVNLALSGNLMVGLTADTKVQFREELAASLRKLGINNTEIDKAAGSFDEMFNKYHKNKFLASLSDETKKTIQDDVTPEKIHALNLSLSPESEALLEDWEFFMKNKKLRRPELWNYHAAG